MKKLRFNSKTIHGGQEIDSAFNAIMPPDIKHQLMFKIPWETQRL